MSEPAASLTTRLDAIRRRIAVATADSGRSVAAVGLVAVSKTHPAAAVAEALAAGQRVFGENRVQEAEGKFPALRPAWPALRLHLIGPLQTNKVKAAVALFDVIETVDRPRLAAALAAEMARSGRRPGCLIQVNIGAEPQKAGIAPEAADAFIAECRTRWALPVEGLMCIPPAGTDPWPHFQALAALARHHDLPILSMGMSGDFETAIACGATLVRIGTAIFGHRD